MGGLTYRKETDKIYPPKYKQIKKETPRWIRNVSFTINYFYIPVSIPRILNQVGISFQLTLRNREDITMSL